MQDYTIEMMAPLSSRVRLAELVVVSGSITVTGPGGRVVVVVGWDDGPEEAGENIARWRA